MAFVHVEESLGSVLAPVHGPLTRTRAGGSVGASLDGEVEWALLSSGVHYHYLLRSPRRARSSDDDPERLFGPPAAPAGAGQDIGWVVPT